MCPLFGRKKPEAANDAFIALIDLAREDPAFGKQLKAVLSQTSFHRKSSLHSMVENMRLQRAPGDLITAMESLADDRIALKALDLIQDADP